MPEMVFVFALSPLTRTRLLSFVEEENILPPTFPPLLIILSVIFMIHLLVASFANHAGPLMGIPQ